MAGVRPFRFGGLVHETVRGKSLAASVSATSSTDSPSSRRASIEIGGVNVRRLCGSRQLVEHHLGERALRRNSSTMAPRMRK